MAKKLKSKKAAVDPNLIDYYSLFNLDRKLSEKDLVVELNKQININRKKQRMVIQGSANHTELQKWENLIHEAIKVLNKKETRIAYDEKLDAALENGTLNTTAQKIAEDVYAEIEKMFDMNNFNGVIRKCQELLSNNSVETKLYTYMARSYLMSDRPTEAIRAVDDCLNIHPNDFDALQLAARFYNMCNNDLQKSQSFVNRMLELDTENSLAIAEQGYLYLCMNNKEMAFKTFEEYITAHPTNEAFREYCATDIINYSYRLFVKDETGTELLISQEAYNECLELAEKAASIYDNEDIRNHLEYTKQFGQVEFNEENSRDIKWTFGSGIVAIIVGIAFPILMSAEVGSFVEFLPILIALVLFGATCIFVGIQLYKVSMRPYWQIYKFKITRKREKKEQMYVIIGEILSAYLRYSFKISWWFIKLSFRWALPG